MIENSIVETVDQEHERWIVLKQLEEWIEIPMLVLSFVWFFLVLAELIWGEGGPVRGVRYNHLDHFYRRFRAPPRDRAK